MMLEIHVIAWDRYKRGGIKPVNGIHSPPLAWDRYKRVDPINGLNPVTFVPIPSKRGRVDPINGLNPVTFVPIPSKKGEWIPLMG
jgi:hypothetical protein